MITDAEIANWNAVSRKVQYLVTHGHKFFMFHIGSDSDELLDISKNGGIVIPVESAKDLPGLVVREVQRVYS